MKNNVECLESRVFEIVEGKFFLFFLVLSGEVQLIVKC